MPQRDSASTRSRLAVAAASCEVSTRSRAPSSARVSSISFRARVSIVSTAAHSFIRQARKSLAQVASSFARTCSMRHASINPLTAVETFSSAARRSLDPSAAACADWRASGVTSANWPVNTSSLALATFSASVASRPARCAMRLNRPNPSKSDMIARRSSGLPAMNSANLPCGSTTDRVNAE